MTEQQLADLIALQKTLTSEFDKARKDAADEGLDGLNKDLAVTMATAVQTLLGLVTVRIGLNISSVRRQSTTDDEQTTEGSSGEQA